ncbi:hypothetical protein I316_07688 [Kwoniella heveanensis BCC8398]|uniref:Elongator complex protein 5 n=1 Tax=Kwoniella heveanensis BCC8398 TaxID=1296120 RepID=A0A1B9GHV6_9TREE|nr:hypothetical protein I316_07688 [Kwoniella heveanensis BCC8398]
MPRQTLESGPLLEGVLNGAQVPHQPLCIVHDRPTFSGLPVFKEMLRRAVRRNESITLISVLHAPQDLLPLDSSSSSSDRTSIIDLTDSIPGYSDKKSGSPNGFDSLGQLADKVVSSYQGGQVFIDALDVLAEDYSPSSAISFTRTLLKAIRNAKGPSRLVLLLEPSSPFYSHLIPPTFSPTLTLLSPHPPALVEHLSKSYLSPISSFPPSPNLWMILENATKRSIGAELAYRGEEGLEVDPEWLGDGKGVVQVLVRKATGGIKGISRSLEALARSASTGSMGDRDQVQAKGNGEGLGVIPLEEILDLNPFTTPISGAGPGPGLGTVDGQKPITSHAELDLPFNLNLTDDQKRKRAAVPLPYAHEGEGASGDLIWAEEEDEDDEEI